MCLALAVLILASACQPVQRSLQGDETPQYYRPAAPAAATPTPAVAEQAAQPDQPQPTPVCYDNLTFVSDVTIEDGSQVQPGATLDKRWEVQNSGNCNWDGRYRLRLIAGPAMDAVQEQALYPARSGANVTLQIIFQAPPESGSYHSAWQAYNPAGQPFGDPVFIDIVVVDGEETE